MKPTISRIVHCLGFESNGSTLHPAIVTRVHSDKDPADGDPVMVNVTVFPDFMSPKYFGSLQFFESSQAAKEFLENLPEDAPRPLVCFWPDR